MLSNTGIKPLVQEEIGQLARRYSLEEVVLFGSRARGDFRRGSDIDLAVRGGDLVRFALDVEEETSTLLMFDVVDLGCDLSPALRQAIEREGRILYEKV